MASPDITVRRAGPDDVPAIVDVAGAALGWAPGEPHEALFRWKHLANPAGESPMWLAEADGRVAGFRAMMRWELRTPEGDRLSAVRAVDTATHPAFQRRGVFSRLTSAAVEELTAAGVGIVFNTPNDRSRPGYLKLGWIEVGRLPLAVRPVSVRGAARMARARTAAEKWSQPSSVGRPAAEVVADPAIDPLLASQPLAGVATAVDRTHLRWRYGLELLHYRALAPSGVAEGVVLFRDRRRGGAVECVVDAVLAPGGDRARQRALLGALASAVDADYLLRLGPSDPRGGFVPLVGQGPRLTARALTASPEPSVDRWALTLGDVELF